MTCRNPSCHMKRSAGLSSDCNISCILAILRALHGSPLTKLRRFHAAVCAACLRTGNHARRKTHRQLGVHNGWTEGSRAQAWKAVKAGPRQQASGDRRLKPWEAGVTKRPKYFTQLHINKPPKSRRCRMSNLQRLACLSKIKASGRNTQPPQASGRHSSSPVLACMLDKHPLLPKPCQLQVRGTQGSHESRVESLRTRHCGC